MSATRMAVATEHAVLNGAPLEPPFPAGLEQAVFGMGCFWGAERSSGSCRACTRPRSATPAAPRSIRLTGKCAAAGPNHAEVVRVIFDPKKVSYSDC